MGIARTFTRTALNVGLDVASGVARLAENALGSAGTPAVLRIQLVILSDEDGRPLTTPEAVQPAVELADRAFLRGAGTRIRLAGRTTVAEPAPSQALDPRANRGLLVDHLLGHTDFYRQQSGSGALDLVGTPVTVVVVRHIQGNSTGCSLGIRADWVIVQASLFDSENPAAYDESVLGHELGHALNLRHHRDTGNLMFPASSPPEQVRGTTLTRVQRAVIQGNRHVVPGVAG